MYFFEFVQVKAFDALLHWSYTAVSKANRAIYILRNSFKILDFISLKHLYCSLVRPYLDYAVSVKNFYFVKDIKLLEGVQRRATKLVKELKNLPYEIRLKKLELTTLEQRRDRGDLIQMYKIIYGLEDVRLIKGLNFVDSDHFTRGNSLKLRRELVKNCTPRFNFLTNRVVDNWNALSDEIVRAKNINCFKAKPTILSWITEKMLAHSWLVSKVKIRF